MQPIQLNLSRMSSVLVNSTVRADFNHLHHLHMISFITVQLCLGVQKTWFWMCSGTSTNFRQCSSFTNEEELLQLPKSNKTLFDRTGIIWLLSIAANELFYFIGITKLMSSVM